MNFLAEILKIEACHDNLLIQDGDTEILFGNLIVQK